MAKILSMIEKKKVTIIRESFKSRNNIHYTIRNFNIKKV